MAQKRPCRSNLTPRQEKAIAALLECNTIKAAAKKTGVSDTALRNWLRDDELFKARYSDALQEIANQSIKELSKNAKEACETLKRNLKCKVPAVEVRAAVAILDKVLSSQIIADMQSQIEELRGLLNGDAGGAQEPDSAVE